MRLKASSIVWTALVCLAICRSPAHAAALRTIDNIDLNGNHLYTDSFNSYDFAHSSNGAYPVSEPAKRLAGGDIRTGGSLVNTIGVGNAEIRGHVAIGPLGNTVQLGPNGTIGEIGYVGDIQPGHLMTNLAFSYASASVPSDFSAGGIIYNNLLINGIRYGKAITSSGDYLLPSLGTNLYIGSNIYCRIKITGNISLTGTNHIRVCAGAVVKIYIQGVSAEIKGNGIANENPNPASFYLFCLPSTTSVNLGGNGSFVGVVYAPQAAFAFGGGGNNPLDFIGCVTAKTIKLNTHVSFHFDEALYRIGPFAPPVITDAPQSQIVSVGQTVTFSGSGLGFAGGTNGFGYQWYYCTNLPPDISAPPPTNWVALAGATNTTLVLTNVGDAQVGWYGLAITNIHGTTRAQALLTLSTAPLLTVTSQNPFQFNVSGISSGNYAVESSTNMIDWERIITNTVPFSITDTNLDALPQRFYRAVYLP